MNESKLHENGGTHHQAQFPAPAPSPSPVCPGVIVTHSPASSGQYIGSPGLALLPGGRLAAKCDLFGPKSSERENGLTRVFVSGDGGDSWEHRADVLDMYWATIFVHRDRLYLLGTTREYGSAVISCSEDEGRTWTPPREATLCAGEYHGAPVPVLAHGGRLWRAFEQREPACGWGDNFRALVLSVDENADLLNPAHWTVSNALPRGASWNGGDFFAWLEGNMVATPAGELVNVLRVHTDSPREKAAMVRVDASGANVHFQPEADVITFPGGAKKFTIRHDAHSGLYWTLTNAVPNRYQQPNPSAVRNTLALACSRDLRDWEIASIVLFHPDPVTHGFQYVDWHFSGEDMLFLSRTAYDDAAGGACNYHDANFLTFHRLAAFRHRTLADAPLNAPGLTGHEILRWPCPGGDPC